MRKVRGNKVTTREARQEILADGNDATVERIVNAQIQNMGEGEIHVVINGGDEIWMGANETLSLGELVVESIVVVESGATVRFIGVE